MFVLLQSWRGAPTAATSRCVRCRAGWVSSVAKGKIARSTRAETGRSERKPKRGSESAHSNTPVCTGVAVAAIVQPHVADDAFARLSGSKGRCCRHEERQARKGGDEHAQHKAHARVGVRSGETTPRSVCAEGTASTSAGRSRRRQQRARNTTRLPPRGGRIMHPSKTRLVLLPSLPHQGERDFLNALMG